MAKRPPALAQTESEQDDWAATDPAAEAVARELAEWEERAAGAAGPALRLTVASLDGGALQHDAVPREMLVRHPQGAGDGACGRRPAEAGLRIATWNLFFDDLAKVERMRGVLSELADQRVDVACLQEVTRPQLAVLLSDPRVRDTCWTAAGGEGCFRGYGVAVISTIPITAATLWELPTNMDRGLLEIRLAPAGSAPLRCGCVHLESLNSPALRRQQLLCSAALLQRHPQVPAVLCGDFNFDDTKNFADITKIIEGGTEGRAAAGQLENAVLAGELTEWIDAWRAVHPDTPGWTYDTVLNGMLSANRWERMRYDRVLLHRSAGGGLRPSRAALLGTLPVAAPAAKELYPYHQLHDAQSLQRWLDAGPAVRYSKSLEQMPADRPAEWPAGGSSPAAALATVAGADESLDRIPIFPSDHFGVVVDVVPAEACVADSR
eukprot:TRINITY_DN27667_c0_g1_i1.p1 TRINITY_DN27667_c0_g1~~TRINITY_DN27667_c0_g1_i1.p1  ORF type:complete len:466 (+),score=101.66 TRINITY_DN27667_c0_g1_i1:92-1399(+)